MKNIITTIILLLFIKGTIFSQLTQEDININGDIRLYYQYLPSGFNATNESLPLVIVLHGLGGDALSLSNSFNWIADTARFIPVYLQGEPNFQGQNSWNNGTLLSSTVDDVSFISQLIDSMIVNYNVNPARVYCTGISMGAIMTYRAIETLNDKIAAVSCHIGTMSLSTLQNYNPIYPVPVQHVHGTNDAIVPYDGTPMPSLSLVPETINKLKSVNGFQGDSTIVQLPDNVNDGITLDKITYNCTTPLELIRMNNAGHIYLLQPTNDTTGMFLTWHFFRQFTHSNPTVSIDENQKQTISVYPNPVSKLIHIKANSAIKEITLYDLKGGVVYKYRGQKDKINVSHLEKGVYLLSVLLNNDKHILEKVIIE